jgi:hypothetical protein
MGKMKDTYIVDPKDSEVALLGAEVMKARKESANKKTKQDEIRPEFSINELRRYAQMTIEERIKFCREYKKDEPFDKCVCESIERWIHLFQNHPMQGSKELGKARVSAVERMFEEMKKEGKIKC